MAGWLQAPTNAQKAGRLLVGMIVRQKAGAWKDVGKPGNRLQW